MLILISQKKSFFFLFHIEVKDKKWCEGWLDYNIDLAWATHIVLFSVGAQQHKGSLDILNTWPYRNIDGISHEWGACFMCMTISSYIIVLYVMQFLFLDMDNIGTDK